MRYYHLGIGIIVVLAVFLAGGAYSFAQGEVFDPHLSFARGNSLYRENKYDQALGQYEKILAHGLESGALYYNIGNCYFKKGELGRAVLSYERSRALLPQDSDLKSNYDYLKSELNLKSEGFGASRVGRFFDKISARYTVDFLAAFLSGVYWVACFFALFCLFFRGLRKFRLPLFIVALCLFCLGAMALKRKIDYLHSCAVVIAPKTEVRFEPLDSATTYYSLEEGSLVKVMEVSQDWSKVRRGDGLAGWLRSSTINFLTDSSGTQ